MTRNRQILLVIVAAVALLAMYRDPQAAGAAVRGTFLLLAGAVHGVFQMATTLTG